MILDEVGPWSETKLEIIREYTGPYSRILARRPGLHHIYIDAFAGSGSHISRATGQIVPGSPLNALRVSPPFREYHFIELRPPKVEDLRAAVGDRPNVHVHQGDCNKVLLDELFPELRRDRRKRALCVLDPYGLHLKWEVLLQAGQIRTVEVLLNFSIMDANRNALWRSPGQAPEDGVDRLSALWGDSSWTSVAYEPGAQLSFFDANLQKTGPWRLIQSFCRKLIEVAGFTYTVDPVPMRNSKRGLLYYLVFACQEPTAHRIMQGIFKKHREWSQPRLLNG